LPYAFYEKTADGAVRDITDELPFEIPESWEWVRLDTLCSTITDGDHQPPPQVPSGVPFLVISNVSQGYFDWDNTRFVSEEYYNGIQPQRKAQVGDILFTVTGSYGIPLVVADDRKFCFQRHIALLKPIVLNVAYLMLLLQSPCVKRQCDDIATGTAQKTVSLNSLRNLIVPLSPSEEQQRIMGCIEAISSHITDYDVVEQKLTTINATFPNTLKKSILQAAVQGKLVPQAPTDEPASVLLERIRAEKEALIKAGKIKRDKHESVIYRRDNSHSTNESLFFEEIDGVERCIDDELPFEIPNSWLWVRLDSMCEYIQRGKSPKYSLVKKYPVIAQKCNQWSGFSIDKAQFIEPESISSYATERILQDGDLLWNSTGLGTLGRIAIYKTELNPYELAVADSHVTVIRPMKNFVLSEYLYAYFANPSVQSVIESQSDGTTKQKELATITVKNYYVPLPPFTEQIRIVERLEKALSRVKKVPLA
jgi:type I restriction enzyme S subunit